MLSSCLHNRCVSIHAEALTAGQVTPCSQVTEGLEHKNVLDATCRRGASGELPVSLGGTPHPQEARGTSWPTLLGHTVC